MSEPTFNQIDLSAFPNITPPSPQEQKVEVERRSLGLATIRSQMENLVNTMQSYLGDLQALDSEAKILELKRGELLELEKNIRMAHTALKTKETNINSQLKYIESENKIILDQKSALATKKEEQDKEFQEREEKLELALKQVNDKLTQLQN